MLCRTLLDRIRPAHVKMTLYLRRSRKSFAELVAVTEHATVRELLLVPLAAHGFQFGVMMPSLNLRS